MSKPIVGYMIFECEEREETGELVYFDGQITGPSDPTGANLAWERAISMIEKSAYDALQAEFRQKLQDRDAQCLKLHNKNLDLQAEVARLLEALEFYADYEEWVDYKAVCADGTEVDSHFDGDMGAKARTALQLSPVQTVVGDKS